MNTRSDVDDSQTAIDYSNMQVRYYGDDYASINAMVSVTTTVRGERRTSHIGQCASLRRVEGQWRINMVQATPLSIDIQDIDSYPLSFAEDEIENYRRQAQFSSIMRRFTSARKRSAAMATRSTAMAPIPEQKTGLEQKGRFLFQACPV